MAVELSTLADRYEQEGYAIVRNAVDPELLDEIRKHVDWLHARYPEKKPKQLHVRDVDDPFYIRAAGDDGLLDIAEAILGPNIAVFATGYLLKEPGVGFPVLWHQDGSYWPLDPMEVTTLWLSIEASTPENGCMRVIPRTHTLNLQEMQTRNDVENFLESEIAPEFVDESQAVDLILEPGDVSMHHPNIIHGSYANRSDKWRKTLIVRYIAASTRITQQPWPGATLLRGVAPEDVAGQYSAKPKYVEGRHMPFRGCEAWR